MIFKAVGDSRPYPDHALSLADWAAIPPRQVRLADLVTTKRTLELDTLLTEDSTFYGDLFAHVVQWHGELYLEDGLHRALRAALQQRSRSTPGCSISTRCPAWSEAARLGAGSVGPPVVAGGDVSNFSTGAGGLAPTGGGGRRGLSTGTIVAIVVGMALLFAAGFGLSRLLNGSSSGGSGGSTSEPCVTTTVTPGAGLPKPATVTVNVYNATDRSGLARKTAVEMKARGFVIGKVANDPLGKSVVVSAEVRHGPKGLAQARLVSFYVPGSVLVADTRADATVDMVLGEAYSGVASPAEVTKALASPSPTSSGPGCATPTPTASATASGTAPAVTTTPPPA